MISRHLVGVGAWQILYRYRKARAPISVETRTRPGCRNFHPQLLRPSIVPRSHKLAKTSHRAILYLSIQQLTKEKIGLDLILAAKSHIDNWKRQGRILSRKDEFERKYWENYLARKKLWQSILELNQEYMVNKQTLLMREDDWTRRRE